MKKSIQINQNTWKPFYHSCMCSELPPPQWTLQASYKSRNDTMHVARMFLWTSWRITSYSSNRFNASNRYTREFKDPNNQKSAIVKSGERGGYGNPLSFQFPQIYKQVLWGLSLLNFLYQSWLWIYSRQRSLIPWFT